MTKRKKERKKKFEESLRPASLSHPIDSVTHLQISICFFFFFFLARLSVSRKDLNFLDGAVLPACYPTCFPSSRMSVKKKKSDGFKCIKENFIGLSGLPSVNVLNNFLPTIKWPFLFLLRVLQKSHSNLVSASNLGIWDVSP